VPVSAGPPRTRPDPAASAAHPIVGCPGTWTGDVDAEVAGETGEAVGVALSDGAESPGPVSAVDLEADERGFHGRGGLEYVLGVPVACGSGDADVVDIREAPAVDTDCG